MSGSYTMNLTLPDGYRVISAFMPTNTEGEGFGSPLVTVNGWTLNQLSEKVSNRVEFRYTVDASGGGVPVHFQVLAERCNVADIRRIDATLTEGGGA